MQEPRARVVSEEPDGDIVVAVADAHDITDDRVVIVISRAASTADDVEGVPVQVDRMLE
jgi:hypothetical protein